MRWRQLCGGGSISRLVAPPHPLLPSINGPCPFCCDQLLLPHMADSVAVADVSTPAVNKSYRRSVEIEYLDTLIVKSMVAVLEVRSRTTVTMFHDMFVAEYHQQMRDENSNPRPRRWTLHEHLRHSAFRTEAEWTTYFESYSNEHAGMPPSMHHWVQLKFSRWRFIKREILNHTHAQWVGMFLGSKMPTGKNMWPMTENLRAILFQKWMMAPTRKGGHCNYKPQPMIADFIPFSTWHLWVRLGPGGIANETFMNQCCSKNPAEAPFDDSSDDDA